MEPLGKAWPDVNKAEALIQAVRNSGDEGQLKNVKQHADSANAKVKLAALSCQAAFGDAGALDKLIGLCNGNDKTDALQALSMLSSGKLKPEDLGKMAEKIVALAEAAAASAPDAPATGDAVSAARMFAGDPRLAAENGPKLLARIPRPKGAAKLIAELPLEQVAKDVLTVKGDKMMGKQFFARQICVNCHTTSPDEKPKGPYLGDVGDKYSRKELVESITNPGANIAQGYEANIVLLKDGTRAEGFVGRETGDEIEIRNIAGEVKVIQKADIKKRAEQHGSLMPVGLVNTLTVEEFASLLAYLESLRTQ
jgi:putative heme-binding domain-containing protein